MDISQVLEAAHECPFKTKSNFAREYANEIAAAASEGFLTTKFADGSFTRSWRLTPLGLSVLYAMKGSNHD